MEQKDKVGVVETAQEVIGTNGTANSEVPTVEPEKKEMTKKKEKKKRSEEERKERKEKKRRKAEENGMVAVCDPLPGRRSVLRA